MWNGKPDRCYNFTYRDGRKMVWKKVDKLSECYRPEVAVDLRAKTIIGRNTDQEVLAPKENANSVTAGTIPSVKLLTSIIPQRTRT
jgi:hypothetical protein